MSVTEMVNAAKGTGLTGTALIEAIAISLAENSTSDPTLVHHNSDGSVDRGYWQINSVHTQYDPYRLLHDANYNAHAMYELSNGGTNWSPWATYPAKAQANIPEATQLVSGTATDAQNADWNWTILGPIPSNPLKDATGAVKGAEGVLKAVGSLTSHLLDGRWWARIGQGALALLLLVMGLLLIFRKEAIKGGLAVATDGLSTKIPEWGK